MKQRNRNQIAYTLVELIVVLSLITGVIALLFFYNKRGQKVYNKSLDAAILQANARSALEQMMRTVKQASKDYIYIDTGFNTGVPLPDDAFNSKPYIYFAKPNLVEATEQTEVFGVKQIGLGGKRIGFAVDNYDYWLFYIARTTYEPKSIEDDKYIQLYSGKARMKSLVFRGQSRSYTEDSSKEWPFLPPIVSEGVNQLPEDLTEEELALLEDRKFEFDEFGNLIPDPNAVADKSELSFLSLAEVQNQTPEFSIYQSDFFFAFNQGNDDLFKFRVKLINEQSKTKVEFESAVTPRN